VAAVKKLSDLQLLVLQREMIVVMIVEAKNVKNVAQKNALIADLKNVVIVVLKSALIVDLKNVMIE
jgi:hypothetical protein